MRSFSLSVKFVIFVFVILFILLCIQHSTEMGKSQEKNEKSFPSTILLHNSCAGGQIRNYLTINNLDHKRIGQLCVAGEPVEWVNDLPV
jgi:hypothetical protein